MFALSVGEANKFDISNIFTGEKITPTTKINVFSYFSINCIEPIKEKKINAERRGVYFAIGDKSSTVTFWLIDMFKGETRFRKKGFLKVPFVWILTIASFWKYSGSEYCNKI